MDVTGWLARADLPEVRQSIKQDPYSLAYPRLLSHFNEIDGDFEWHDFVVGLHIVYGWMPTIPDLERICSNESGSVAELGDADKGRVVSALRIARAATKEMSSTAAAELLNAIRPFVNNSLVGSSKLLHFINPNVFPIWDSRVARRFLRTRGRPSHDKMQNSKLWDWYFEAISDWRLNVTVIQKCNELRNLAAFLSDATDTRIIELVLFHPAPEDRDDVRDT